MEEKTDLRIRKTYKALCDAFVTILEKKRFDDLTVNELCDEATIRRATFYKHFADKHDFFSFFIRQKQDQFISQAKEETPPNGIYAYTLYLTQRSILYFKEHESLIQNILKSDMSASPLDIFNEEIHSNILKNTNNAAAPFPYPRNFSPHFFPAAFFPRSITPSCSRNYLIPVRSWKICQKC